MLDTLRIEDLDDLSFDPFATDEMAWGDIIDPYPIFEQYRREKSVHPIEYRMIFTDVPDPTLSHYPTWSVFGYDDVLEVLMRPDLYSSTILNQNLGVAFGRSIIVMDAPEHTLYRRIFQKVFSPAIVRKWVDDIVDPIIHGLIDKIVDKGKADLVADFTEPFPFHVIYRQLGLPEEDGRIFHKLACTQLFWVSDPDKTDEAGKKLTKFFGALLDERRANPGDDLVSLLATAQHDGQFLPRETLIAFLRQLINAAGDTTYRTTGTLLMALLRHPDQLEAIRRDRSLIPQAIDEALRWDGPVLMNWRGTTQDVTLGGVAIPAGACVNIVQASAHRDESKFVDGDRFDIFRDRTHRHFGFATGPHVCLGQHLARLEMERAITALLDRLPNLRLDPDHPVPVSRGFHLRSPDHVHARFDA